LPEALPSNLRREKMTILKRMLNNKKMGWERKLLALLSLAKMASKESLEIIEDYCRNPDPGMKEYARLALGEARYLIGVGAK